MKKSDKFFNEYGDFIGEIPEDAINQCSLRGAGDVVYENVNYWMDELNFDCPQELAKKYLRNFGAWEDLNKADRNTINRRVFWLACCELDESGEWLGLID
ncbi:MAG: hypothetical protein WC688_07355 [Parachlamydiales bacterium]|jgi:hypothetical protein